MVNVYNNSMNCNEETADSLKDICQDLWEISGKIRNTKVDDNDHLGFMSLCFLSKQTDHVDAILKLYPHHDIQLISRTMIEGLTQLLWCFKYPKKALQWRAFAWVSDWRLSKSIIANGQNVPDEDIKAIEKSMKVYGDIFKKKKNLSDSDPYHSNWKCGKSLKDVSSEVEGDSLYKMLYSPFSDWQHWGVTSMGAMIKRKENSISYGGNNPKTQLCAPLAVAFQCLYQVLKLVDEHHNVDISEQLDRVYAKHIKYHKSTQPEIEAQPTVAH